MLGVMIRGTLGDMDPPNMVPFMYTYVYLLDSWPETSCALEMSANAAAKPE